MSRPIQNDLLDLFATKPPAGPRVLNKYRDKPTPGAVNIMRGGPWGNEFVIGRDGDRAAVVAKHRARVNADPALQARIRAELRGRDLICCCKPAACHGDVYLEIANAG